MQKFKPHILDCSEDAIKTAAKELRRGKILVVPTNSVYGIVCDASNEEATSRLREICGSPEDKPLTVVIDKKDIGKYAVISKREEKIAELLLPSSCSLFVKKKGGILDHSVKNSPMLCVMWQNSEVSSLYKYAERVISITSANPKGAKPAVTIGEAVDYFGDAVDLYLNNGPSSKGVPSAQLDISKEPVTLLRTSPDVSLEAIQKQLSAIN